MKYSSLCPTLISILFCFVFFSCDALTGKNKSFTLQELLILRATTNHSKLDSMAANKGYELTDFDATGPLTYYLYSPRGGKNRNVDFQRNVETEWQVIHYRTDVLSDYKAIIDELEEKGFKYTDSGEKVSYAYLEYKNSEAKITLYSTSNDYIDTHPKDKKYMVTIQ